MKRHKIFFPIHLDGGNRGCEAIAKGTIEVLGLKKEQYIGLASDMRQEEFLKINEVATLIPQKKIKLYQRVINKLERILFNDCSRGIKRHHKFIYKSFLNQIKEEDICFITGGDMLCYGDNQIIYIVEELYKRNIPTVLWGCSFGKENLSLEKERILRYLSYITARESLTYDYLTNELQLKNVQLVADPAFILEPVKCSLPEYFNKDIIGINLSNFVTEEYSCQNVFFESVMGFIDYIITETNLMVVLIPHVFWDGQDDRVVCELIKKSYKETNRIEILDSLQFSYCEIRYIISKCKYFIGARTHAMISAYATCTPALALGYSIKAKGIAKDLELDDKLVIDYRNVMNKNDLIDRFNYLVENESNIKEHLEKIMPDYKNKAYIAKEVLNRV